MKNFQDFKCVKIKSTREEIENPDSELNYFISRFNKLAPLTNIIKDQPLPNKYIDVEMYVWNTPSNIHIVGRALLSPKLIHYQINDEGKNSFDINVSQAYKKLNKYKDKDIFIPDLVKQDVSFRKYTSSPLIYSNPDFRDKELKNCIQYDLNKAYCHALRFDIPDTNKMRECDILEENEVGFRVTDKKVIHIFRDGTSEKRECLERITRAGYAADFVFPLIKSPFLAYVDKMEKDISKAKLDGDKQKEASLKSEIVCAVGNYQNHNPFIRANIVEGLNQAMQALMDNNTVYCNTDSIVSLKERNDLVIGKAIGEWKVEASGTFRCFGDKGVNYIWNNGEKKSCRGPQKNEKLIMYNEKEKRLVRL